VPEKKGKLSFQVSANLQKLVGEELVTNEEMAVLELVKNAYDSGAKEVVITIQPVSSREPGFISIRDDGPGMSLAEFRGIFMFAGYSERDTQAQTATRVPTGEKGIGRFAADRLGSRLDLYTKTAASSEALRVSFDWTAFRNKKKKFGDIRIPYQFVDRADLLPERATGTILEIRNLRTSWTRAKLQSVRNALGSLIDPYGSLKGFRIELRVPSMPALTGTIQQLPPGDADYEIRFKVSDDGKFFFRKVKTPTTRDKEWEPVPTAAVIGNLRSLGGRFLYYIKRPPRTAFKGLSPGVQIYRDGFRLQPFGAPLEPWLQLTEKRAKRAGHAPLVPSRLFGFVEVSRLLQPGIKDITSRQGLMETEDFHQLIIVLREQIAYLEEQIRQQVSIPSWKERGKERSIEIERSKVQSLGDLSIGIGHEIRQPLQSIVSETGAIEERLTEMGIDDPELHECIETIYDSSRRIDETIRFIQDFAKGDLEFVDKFDLADAVRKTCRLFSTQAKIKGININPDLPESEEARTNRNSVERALANLLKNAVEAIQERRNYGEGEIDVKLRQKEGEHIITVSDNGGGIPKDIVPKIFKTFATKKTAGLGYGLSHSKTIIQAHGGDITFKTTEGEGTEFVVTIPDIAV
jgi:signal transduction histidine kinase